MIQKEAIKQYLLQVLDRPQLVSGGNEIACPCPFCGEQRPKLYIGPFNDPNKPITYNCFICKSHGYLNQDFLDDIGISKQLDPEILNSNKGSDFKMGFSGNNSFYNILWDNVTMNELSEYKLKYVNDRLGLRFTYEDCIRNKIILNISDLLSRNGINYLTRHPNTVQQLNYYFIGFLSRSNASLNMRNIISGSYAESKLEESLQQKYINYKVFKNTPDNDFYILPCNVDLNKHIKLYIAEGPFDVLGIKYNLIKSEDNCVYIAGRGKAYEKALYWFIHTAMPFSLEVHFFPDADVDDKMITNIVRNYSVFGYQFFLHRNKYRNEKDFGVPEWRMDDFCYKI